MPPRAHAWPRFQARRASFVTGILHTACRAARTDDLLAQIPATPDPNACAGSRSPSSASATSASSRIVRDCFLGDCYTAATRERVIARLATLRQALTTEVYPRPRRGVPERPGPLPSVAPVGCPMLAPVTATGGSERGYPNVLG